MEGQRGQEVKSFKMFKQYFQKHYYFIQVSNLKKKFSIKTNIIRVSIKLEFTLWNRS
jgi:hypothetical protein